MCSGASIEPETFSIILIPICGLWTTWVMMPRICCLQWNDMLICYTWIVYNAGDMERERERWLDHVWGTANSFHISNWSFSFYTGSFDVYNYTYVSLYRSDRVGVGSLVSHCSPTGFSFFGRMWPSVNPKDVETSIQSLTLSFQWVFRLRLSYANSANMDIHLWFLVLVAIVRLLLSQMWMWLHSDWSILYILYIWFAYWCEYNLWTICFVIEVEWKRKHEDCTFLGLLTSIVLDCCDHGRPKKEKPAALFDSIFFIALVQ